MGNVIMLKKPGGVEPQTHIWQQTPPPVQEYLDYVAAHPYDSSDYSYSVIQDFAPPTLTGANDRPIGQAVVLDAGVLNVGGYEKTVSAGSSTIYNTVPNIETPYALIDGSVKQTGTLKPNKPLRQIRASTRNVRDLGGWACDGGHIRYGKLFRGGEVSSSADVDLFLRQLGIRAELDLQGTAASETSVLSSYVDYCAPSDGTAVWGEYTLANKTQMREAIRFLFDCVKNSKPLYFHCAAGADRTGTFACVIESLLGVSASDIDADYELTSFVDPANSMRERTRADWGRLIGQIKQLSGETWQDKMANYIASLGFTTAEINAFREAMIDGTPTVLTPSIDTYSVTCTLTHATSDNPAVSVDQYQPYEADITPDSGYVISDIQITMDGTDITGQVWSGEKTELNRSVKSTLSHCTVNNQTNLVIDGQSYAAEITVDSGYTLSGASVQITMGGTDITDQVWMTKEDE